MSVNRRSQEQWDIALFHEFLQIIVDHRIFSYSISDQADFCFL